MRLGMFQMPLHPPARTFTETMAEDREKAILADKLGFEELWVGEHYSATTEPIPSPMMFMAEMIGHTNLTFGTAVINTPNHNPVIVAAEAAQFDHMSRGRFHLGLGPGGLFSDFELFRSTNPAARYRMLTETADIIRYIWSSDPPYNYEGEFWSFSIKDAIIPELGIGYMPKPYQQPGPPVSISLASPNSSSAALAAEQGWNFISANITPPYSVASHWQVYSETMAKLGKQPDGNSWRVARCMQVATTDAEAEERAFGEAGSNRYFFSYIRRVLGDGGLISVIKPRIDLTDEETTVEAVTEACVMYGSPKTVLDKLVAFRDQVGPFGTLLMTGSDWSGPNGAWEQESMRLLAEEVMPRFRQHAEATAAE